MDVCDGNDDDDGDDDYIVVQVQAFHGTDVSYSVVADDAAKATPVTASPTQQPQQQQQQAPDSISPNVLAAAISDKFAEKLNQHTGTSRIPPLLMSLLTHARVCAVFQLSPTRVMRCSGMRSSKRYVPFVLSPLSIVSVVPLQFASSHNDSFKRCACIILFFPRNFVFFSVLTDTLDLVRRPNLAR